MIRIALYGKGGIGKSTAASNLSIVLAQRGYRVLQVGCDPKADSTRLLLSGAAAAGIDPAAGKRLPEAEARGTARDGDREAASGRECAFGGARSGLPEDVRAMVRGLREGEPRTVMDHLRTRAPFTLGDVVREGYAGVFCVEAGGPLPGQGCAGRAVITALEKLQELGAYEILRPDIVLYDVLGDVVCGGFAGPMRRGCADYVFILTSGESMALYAAANIGLALEHFQGRGYARPGGIILNRRGLPDEERRARELAEEIGMQLAGDIPRSSLVQEAETEGMCLMQAYPDSEPAACFRRLADRICDLLREMPEQGGSSGV